MFNKSLIDFFPTIFLWTKKNVWFYVRLYFIIFITSKTFKLSVFCSFARSKFIFCKNFRHWAMESKNSLIHQFDSFFKFKVAAWKNVYWNSAWFTTQMPSGGQFVKIICSSKDLPQINSFINLFLRHSTCHYVAQTSLMDHSIWICNRIERFKSTWTIHVGYDFIYLITKRDQCVAASMKTVNTNTCKWFEYRLSIKHTQNRIGRKKKRLVFNVWFQWNVFN